MSAARVLPREEWGRLEDAGLFTTLRPEDVAVVVVEDEGEIVASLGVLRAPMFEGLRMAPGRASHAGVGRMLLRKALDVASEWSPHWTIAHASIDEDGVRSMLERIGQWLPVHTFMIPHERAEDAVCPL